MRTNTQLRFCVRDNGLFASFCGIFIQIIPYREYFLRFVQNLIISHFRIDNTSVFRYNYRHKEVIRYRMCKICLRARCVSGCPNYSSQNTQGYKIRGVCAICERIMYFSDTAIIQNGSIVCADCCVTINNDDNVSFFKTEYI